MNKVTQANTASILHDLPTSLTPHPPLHNIQQHFTITTVLRQLLLTTLSDHQTHNDLFSLLYRHQPHPSVKMPAVWDDTMTKQLLLAVVHLSPPSAPDWDKVAAIVGGSTNGNGCK